jgi:hypothetical protein
MEEFSMETFLAAIESHPKACAFLILIAILTCTFRFKLVVGKEADTYFVDNNSTK